MPAVPASPARLGRIALALAAVPALALATLLGGNLTSVALHVLVLVAFAVPGPIAVVLGQIAATRWRRQRSQQDAPGFPWCALFASLLGGIETTITVVMWLGWPSC